MTNEEDSPRRGRKVIISDCNALRIAGYILERLEDRKIIQKEDFKEALAITLDEIIAMAVVCSFTPPLFVNCEFYLSHYKPYSSDYVCDFCEVCDKKFALQDGDFTQGYTIKETSHWICQNCFGEYKIKNNWTIIQP